MSESEIKWLPLRLNIIPLIDKQARSVLNLYLSTRKEIINGDILSIQKLTAIKQEVAARVKQIDAFYTKCAIDERAKYLFATRAVLSKIAEQHNDFQKINDFSSQNNWAQAQTPSKKITQEDFPLASTTTQRKHPSQTPTQNNKALTSRPNEDTSRNIYLSDAEKDSKVMRLSDLKKQPLKSKSPINIRDEKARMAQKGTSRKIEQGVAKKGAKKIEQVMELERERNEMNSKLERSPFDINKSFKDLSQLVFTIKMTKEEYNEFMRLKRKNNHA